MKTAAKRKAGRATYRFSRISKKEGLDLYRNADLLGLGMMADRVRKILHPAHTVSFIIDRNINYTNICINKCSFCAFFRDKNAPDAYILSRRKLFQKIRETIRVGGTQILIQGGLHPALEIRYYVDLLKSIKERFHIHIHGFSPPEIWHIADKAGLPIGKTLKTLQAAGLDSIPGGGAEILSDRVRRKISPKKISSKKWLWVMEEAHKLGMKTTATMMFGSMEEPVDIIEHLDAVRRLQDRTGGFTAFIPWSFQPGNTELEMKNDKLKIKKHKSGENSQLSTLNFKFSSATAVEYLRILALSRIYLDNVPNIQASWVTQGLKLAQVALRFGANDFGSTMLEENVVSSTGVSFSVSIQNILNAIRDAGFQPAQRDMYYNILTSDYRSLAAAARASVKL